MPLPEFDFVGIAVSIITLAIAILKLYSEQRKAKKEIELSKQYLQALSRLVESYAKSQESQQQIEKEKLEWKKLSDIGKALWEMAKYEEELE